MVTNVGTIGLSPAGADDLGAKHASLTRRSLKFFRRELLGTFGLALVLVMAASGLSAELIAPYSPTANDFGAMMEAPSWAHPLGTDQFGRDLLSRIVFGARTAWPSGWRQLLWPVLPDWCWVWAAPISAARPT